VNHDLAWAPNGTVRLTVQGELDIVTVMNLRPVVESLVSERPAEVEIDLSGLRIVDSSGVGTLVSLYKQVREQGGRVFVTGLRDQPLAIFRLLQLDQVMASAPLPATPAEAGAAGSAKMTR
jgi:anti-sigma B factor antagonist